MAIRVGIIGCGAIGQRRHIPELKNNPDVELVALCDVLADRARDTASYHNVPKSYSDHKEMLKEEKLDAVVVGTPNAFHAPQAIDAFEAGCHVLVEKPMAATLDEAKAMMAAAKKAGKFLMIGLNQRLMAPHVKAKEILDSGKLGKPINFETSFKHAGPDGWSVDGAKSWFFKKDQAVMGVCGDLGVHKIDLLRYLLGEEITDVTGFVSTINKTYPDSTTPIDVDDNAFLTVRTASGVIGSIMISWCNYGNIEGNDTVIYCENGALQLNTDPKFGVVVNYKNGNKEFHQVGAVSTNEKQVGSGVGDLFIKSIKTNTPPAIDGVEGYKSLEVILGAFESHATGKTIKMKGL